MHLRNTKHLQASLFKIDKMQIGPYTEPVSEHFPQRKSSESTSMLSSESAESHAAKTPTSMPVPVVPRRAGPPRKKPGKPTAVAAETPSLPITEEPSEITEESNIFAQATSAHGEPEQPTEYPVIAEDVKDLEPNETSLPPISHIVSPKLGSEIFIPETKSFSPQDPFVVSSSAGIPSAEEVSGIASPPPSIATGEESEEMSSVAESDDDSAQLPPLTEPSVVQKVDVKLVEVSTPTTVAQEDDEDEAEAEARRTRVAARLAEMGAVNPLALPPQVKPAATEPYSPPVVATIGPSSVQPTSSAEQSSDILPPSSPKPVHITQAEISTESEVDGKY